MLRMLIVEDERWEREGLAEFWDWSMFGISKVDTAVDGIDGLEKALAVEPDIIITDIRMPGMDGIEMAKQVREQLPDVRIIVLTGYDDFGFAREAIRFSASDYVLKPIEEDELRKTVEKVVAECRQHAGQQSLEQGRSVQWALFYGLDGDVGEAEEEEAKRAFAPRAADFARSCQEAARDIRIQAAACRQEAALDRAGELFAMFESETGAGRELTVAIVNALLTELCLLLGEHELPEPVRPQRLLAYASLKEIEEAVRGYMIEWMRQMEDKRLNKDDFVIRKVSEIVESRYGSTELSVTMLAEAAFLSANHLGVVFKKATGKTVHEYIAEVRMTKAEEQLRLSKRKVAQIAAEVGIPNTSYFCSLFKQAYGMTPGEYQELMQRR
ncbi:response regulator [Paenibacillus aurantiacus]|uniref:Response regulator n=1 Tax=Paenibacillus aurantiacus TaxID=1936118 RepID=A0ABV5KUB2_9BACL